MLRYVTSRTIVISRGKNAQLVHAGVRIQAVETCTSRRRARRAAGAPSCSSPSPSWPGTPACRPRTRMPCHCPTRRGPSSQHGARTRSDHGGSRRAPHGSHLQSRCLATPCQPSNATSALMKRWLQTRRNYSRVQFSDLSVHTRNMESAVCFFRNSLMFAMRWA